MLRWLATNRTNLPFFAPLSTDATVNVTVSLTFWTSFDNGVVKGFANGCVRADVSVLVVVTVVAGADADLVFVDVVMMTFLSRGTLFCLFFVFSRWACAPRKRGGARPTRNHSARLRGYCCGNLS